MKIENYLTKEEISDIKGKNLQDLRDIVEKLTTTENETPEEEILNAPSFATAHMGVIYLYLSQLRVEVHEKNPNSKRIPELESIIKTSKHCFVGLKELIDRHYKYFEYKAKVIEYQTKVLNLEKRIEELERVKSELVNGL
jgi:hypothetical protein